MVIRRLLIATGVAVLLVGALPGMLVADPGNGCPALGNPGANPGTRNIQLMTITAGVDRSVAQILPAFYESIGTTAESFYADRVAAFSAEDNNGDGMLCVAEQWGEGLNPKSHWVSVYAGLLANPSEPIRFLVTDNHTGR